LTGNMGNIDENIAVSVGSIFNYSWKQAKKLLGLIHIKMPVMDGFRLYQEIKKIDSKVKVCFLTASELYYERFRKEKEFAEIDEDLFVRKPIGNEDLINKINTIINQVT